jgi:hypothetical protein
MQLFFSSLNALITFSYVDFHLLSKERSSTRSIGRKGGAWATNGMKGGWRSLVNHSSLRTPFVSVHSSVDYRTKVSDILNTEYHKCTYVYHCVSVSLRDYIVVSQHQVDILTTSLHHPLHRMVALWLQLQICLPGTQALHGRTHSSLWPCISKPS